MNSAWMMFCSAAAALPAAMVAANLRHYKPLPAPTVRGVPSVSVLIPARNEEANIRAALESVLQCAGVELEVLVWDDGSTDSTAELVRGVATRDSRVRLIEGEALPEGWAGKPFACWSLAQYAKGEVLVFMDADVRLRGEDSLVRMSAAFLRPELALLSGVPWQRVEALSEVMIVPLIHFVLLGFLPLERMRASTDPRFAAACGQLMLFRRSAYLEVGGHGQTRRSFHEGIGLARAFRKAGLVADLFDATDVAVCRMYCGFGEVWRGFAKNAHEGLASPKSVLPLSVLLFCGQVLPFLALLSGRLSVSGGRWALVAVGLAFAARGSLAVRFGQPLSGVLLQPLAVLLLLLNQWYGALRFWLGKPVGWRGRSLSIVLAFGLAGTCLTASGADSERCPDFVLADQGEVRREILFPRQRPVYLVAASHHGTGQIAKWVKPVFEHYGEKVEILGLADVREIPQAFRGAVRLMIRNGTKWPVLMDWDGKAVMAVCSPDFTTEVLVIQPDGHIKLRLSGAATPEGIAKVRAELDRLLKRGK